MTLELGLPLTHRLENWARHVRDPWHSEPHGRCGSIEGRAIRDALRGDEEADRRAPGAYPIDHADGEIVDRAWRTLVLGDRMLLKWRYVERRPHGWIMRKLGRRGDGFKHAHIAARLAIARSLDDSRSLMV